MSSPFAPSRSRLQPRSAAPTSGDSVGPPGSGSAAAVGEREERKSSSAAHCKCHGANVTELTNTLPLGVTGSAGKSQRYRCVSRLEIKSFLRISLLAAGQERRQTKSSVSVPPFPTTFPRRAPRGLASVCHPHTRHSSLSSSPPPVLPTVMTRTPRRRRPAPLRTAPTRVPAPPTPVRTHARRLAGERRGGAVSARANEGGGRAERARWAARAAVDGADNAAGPQRRGEAVAVPVSLAATALSLPAPARTPQCHRTAWRPVGRGSPALSLPAWGTELG